jgi:hypothetical protein
LGLTPLTENGFQYFSLPINTFPKNLLLKIGHQTFSPGKDYIAAPNCKTVHGKFRVITCDSTLILSSKFKERMENDASYKTAIVLDPSAQRVLKKSSALSVLAEKAGVRIELKSKLTASLAQSVGKQPTVYFFQNAWKTPKGKLNIVIANDFINDYKTQNVVYSILGTAKPDSFLVVSAHYDHLGQMGPSVYFPGANDNASGIAFLLELAKYYKDHPPKYSMVFIAFGAEEAGLVGSEYFVNHPLVPLDKIKFLVNLDLVGTGDDGIQIVNSTIFTKEFQTIKSINDTSQYFKTIKTRGKAANSDHYYFTEKGVPSFFIYALGGISAYHDVEDTSEKLPLTKFTELFQLVTKFLSTF